MSSRRQECNEFARKAGEYICKLADGLSAEQCRALLAMPGHRTAERAVDAAALAEDVAQTKAACRVWWEAFKTDLAALKQAG